MGATWRWLLAALIFAASALGAAMTPAPAQAALLDYDAVPCNDVDRLASVIQAEAYSQPREAHIAIAQIVANEARSRGMTICQLVTRTWFVSVYQYALRNPHSWTMRQMTNVQPWAVGIAEAVLSGVFDDATGGAKHFDGAPCRNPLWQSGQIVFCE